MVDQARARRLAKRIATIVASAIELEIKDPRLRFVTITDAKVTGDLRDATVYYTVMGADLNTEPDYAAAAAGLEKAKGVLRSKVGSGTGVKFTPTLAFVLDTVPDTARHMEELLARARAADDEVAKAAANARHAGDADPYRRPEDASVDETDDETDGEALWVCEQIGESLLAYEVGGTASVPSSAPAWSSPTLPTKPEKGGMPARFIAGTKKSAARIGLLAASIWTWAIMISLGMKIGRVRRAGEAFERDFRKADDIDASLDLLAIAHAP